MAVSTSSAFMVRNSPATVERLRANDELVRDISKTFTEMRHVDVSKGSAQIIAQQRAHMAIDRANVRARARAMKNCASLRGVFLDMDEMGVNLIAEHMEKCCYSLGERFVKQGDPGNDLVSGLSA